MIGQDEFGVDLCVVGQDQEEDGGAGGYQRGGRFEKESGVGREGCVMIFRFY